MTRVQALIELSKSGEKVGAQWDGAPWDVQTERVLAAIRQVDKGQTMVLHPKMREVDVLELRQYEQRSLRVALEERSRRTAAAAARYASFVEEPMERMTERMTELCLSSVRLGGCMYVPNSWWM